MDTEPCSVWLAQGGLRRGGGAACLRRGERLRHRAGDRSGARRAVCRVPLSAAWASWRSVLRASVLRATATPRARAEGRPSEGWNNGKSWVEAAPCGAEGKEGCGSPPVELLELLELPRSLARRGFASRGSMPPPFARSRGGQSGRTSWGDAARASWSWTAARPSRGIGLPENTVEVAVCMRLVKRCVRMVYFVVFYPVSCVIEHTAGAICLRLPRAQASR